MSYDLEYGLAAKTLNADWYSDTLSSEMFIGGQQEKLWLAVRVILWLCVAFRGFGTLDLFIWTVGPLGGRAAARWSISNLHGVGDMKG